MLLFRSIVLFLLVCAALCFAMYAVSGQQRYRHYGWVVLKWTLLSAFGFFAVLIFQRIG